MNTIFSRIILPCATVMMLAGCSTITTGTTQSFAVLTPHADGAKCVLTDSKNASWTIASTPGTVEVSKGDGPMIVKCAKAGYKDTSVVVKEGLAGMTFGNVLAGGGIGIIVDAASGAAQEYPDDVTVWMEPNTWPSAAAQAEWHAEKKKYEDDLKAKQNQAGQKASN